MSKSISASITYAGVADYPGSAFEESSNFSAVSKEPSIAIEEFVDWVINLGAGLPVAAKLNNEFADAELSQIFDYFFDQFVLLNLDIDESLLPQVKIALNRSRAYKATLLIINNLATPQNDIAFRKFLIEHLDKENPGPFLQDDFFVNLEK